jgi:hypothetical protein
VAAFFVSEEDFMEGLSQPSGILSYQVRRAKGPGLGWQIANRLRWSYIRGWIAFIFAPLLAKLIGFGTVTSRLMVRVKKASGEWIDYGVVGYRVVTTAGVTAMSTSFQTPASPGNFFYHGLGTGNTAENASDTQLVTEITTAYNPDSTRPAGTHVAGGSANIYRSVGTVTVDGSAAVTEHGVFSAASAGTLLDRTVFSVVNLSSGDSFVATYELTFTAGG